MSDLDIDTTTWNKVIHTLENVLPFYEKLNSLQTLGRLGAWRKVASALSTKNDIVLEIGPGSGSFAKKVKCKRLYCLDPSLKILRYTRNQLNGKDANLVGGIAEYLPFTDRIFDLVFCIFSFRDFMNKEIGLSEIRRVLKHGGRLCIVEISLPQDGVLKKLVNFHIHHVAPRLSALALPKSEREKWVSELYPIFLETLNSFGPASQYPSLCRKVGFSDVKLKFLLGRSAFILTGAK